MKKVLLSLSLVFIMSPLHAGTITGKVSLAGAAPKNEVIQMNADPQCAIQHKGKGPILSEAVVVGPNKGIRYAFVYVKSGLEGKTFAAPKTPAVLDQLGCHYAPHVLGVQTNQPVEIRNSDPTLHNVHSLAKNNPSFNLAMPVKGMKITKTFAKPEIMIKMKCDVHPWMTTYVGVVDHPFFAVSATDGSFTLKDLPAGTYTVEVWQEKLGSKTQTVTVGAADSKSANFSF